MNSVIPVHPRLLHLIYLIFIYFKHEIVSPTLCEIFLEHETLGKFECKNIRLPALITIKFMWVWFHELKRQYTNFIPMIFKNVKLVYIRREVYWYNAPVIILTTVGYVAFDSQIRVVNLIIKLLQA